MSVQEFRIRVGDRLPKLRMQITSGGVPVDLTTALVSLSGVQRIDGAVVEMFGTTAILDAATGLVEYTFALADSATPRVIDCHWQVDWSNGRLTAPSRCPFRIIVS